MTDAQPPDPTERLKLEDLIVDAEECGDVVALRTLVPKFDALAEAEGLGPWSQGDDTLADELARDDPEPPVTTVEEGREVTREAER